MYLHAHDWARSLCGFGSGWGSPSRDWEWGIPRRDVVVSALCSSDVVFVDVLVLVPALVVVLGSYDDAMMTIDCSVILDLSPA